MSAGRLLLLVIVVAAGAWLYKSQAGSLFTRKETGPSTPIERARAAARASDARNAETAGAQNAADAPPAAGVSENMTPDQVRALLGAPSDTQSETTDMGVRRETWTYRDVGKTVVFENGIVTSIR
ncbi:MAG: hypothetical protein ABI592_00575 [Acidobacteriota bacterium]